MSMCIQQRERYEPNQEYACVRFLFVIIIATVTIFLK